jgi:hypothetical protein
MPKLCQFENCRNRASYAEFYGIPIKCKTHKEKLNGQYRVCHCGSKIPCFNYNGLKPEYCSKCKLDGMLDVSNDRCSCDSAQPSFNFEGLPAEYCSKCKLDGMVCIRSKKCKCNIAQPSFNFEGLKAEYCFKCKLDGMIDLIHKKCNCNSVQPQFNFEGLPAEYCSKCKLDGMIDVNSKKCKCNSVHPSFNFKGLSPEYCSNCKLDGMVDLKHKKCHCGLARPSYNLKGLKAEFCMNCKLDGMIDVNHEKCGCGLARPSYNLKGLDAKFCVTCKTQDMIDVINKKCKANYCLGSLGCSKYKGYCSPCYQQSFPNDPLTFQIRSKTKEIAVRDFINQTFVGFQHDKSLWTGNCECVNRRRIDHRLLIGNTLLCIETDENQHKTYNVNDEEIRYDDLYMLHSGKFIFIRFNPDKYKNENGKTVNPMLYTRLPVLQMEIENQIQRINQEDNNELLEIVKLYYDNYN